MNALVTDFNGNSNIGLYMFVNDKFVLLGTEVSEKHDKEIEEVFGVPVHRITIAGTSLIGVFAAGNNEKIVVPSIIFDDEKKVLEELGIEYEVFDSKFTCLGNNVKVTEKKILVNPEYTEEHTQKLGEIFNLPAEREKIAELGVVGNLIVINSSKKKALISNEITEKELTKLEKELDLKITPSSVNMGSQFLGSGIACNKKGFVIGKMSGSPEILNAEESLGYL